MRDSESLRKWIEKVKESKHWPDSSEWTNYHYQILSEEIGSKLGIRISRTAFRKIIDSIHTGTPYSPQIATRHALAKYIGYDSWEDFVSGNIEKQSPKFGRVFSILLPGVVVIGFVLYFFVVRATSYDFDFVIENPDGVIPHTLVCNYDFGEVKTDNIKIDYGHVNHRNKYTLYPLNKSQTVHKECMHHPGPFKVRVFIDDKVHYSKKVWINSNGWYIYATNSGWDNRDFVVPDFLRKAGVGLLQGIPFEAILKYEVDSLGCFHIPEEKILGIDHISVNYDLHLKNFQRFGVDLHNCTFNLRFKDGEFGNGSHCYETMIALFGERGNIAFRFGEGGCEKYLLQRIGKKFMYGGSTKSVEHLKIDYKEFTTISIQSSANRVQLIVDDEVKTVVEDNQHLGEVRGMHLLFKGAPHVDFVELKNEAGEVVFSDCFDE